MKLSRTAGREKDESEPNSPPHNEEKIHPEGPEYSVKKKKGKRKTPTSLVVIELDDKTADFMFKENPSPALQSLYEVTRTSKNLLFVSKNTDLIEKVDRLDFELETGLIDEKSTKEQQQDQVMKFALEYSSDRINPELSEFVGTLFSKSDLKHEKRFKFGRVISTLQEFLSTSETPQIIQEDQTSQKVSSPTRAGEMEIEKKDLENNITQAHVQTSDEFEASQPEGTQDVIDSVSKFQDQSQYYLFKLKELSSKISSTLTHQFDKIQPRLVTYELDQIQPIPSGQEEKKRFENKNPNYEDVIFAKLKKPSPSQQEENPFIAVEYGNSYNEEVAAKIKNIHFEVQDEMDACPILKKVKASASKTPNNKDSLNKSS